MTLHSAGDMARVSGILYLLFSHWNLVLSTPHPHPMAPLQPGPRLSEDTPPTLGVVLISCWLYPSSNFNSLTHIPSPEPMGCTSLEM